MRYGDVLSAIRDLTILDELVTTTRRQHELLRSRVEEGATPPLERNLLDVELRRFVDIPNDGIVHSEAIPTTVIPLGAVYVWVRDDVRITHRGNWAGPEDPTTMATGEEGGDPTTMATGEEGMGFENPLDLVVNPFGRF